MRQVRVVSNFAGHELLRDTLALAVPLRIMELRHRPEWEREALLSWAKGQFRYADVMMFDPQRKPGQLKHLIDILALMALTADGGVEFAGMRYCA